jgi:hypothetical protein
MSYVVNGIEVHDLSTAFEVAAKGQLPSKKAVVRKSKKGKRLLLAPANKALAAVDGPNRWNLLPWVLLGVAVGGIAVYLWTNAKHKKGD